MNAVMQYFGKLPKTTLLVMAGGLILAMGMVDYLTGPELAFSIFYLIPIMMIAWFVNRRAAFYASVMSALIWLMADLFSRLHYIPLWVLYWNAVLLLGVFLIMTYFISVLKQANDREKERAGTDYLTGVANSRHFYEWAESELERARRYKHPLTIVYMDIDQFKAVNDQMGHAAGDQLLKKVAETMRRNIRSVDMIARIGGDEFVMLFPETGPEEAPIVVQRVQRELMKVVAEKKWPITFSLGVVSCLKCPDTLQHLVSAADRMMYAAKAAGKNTIRCETLADPEKSCPPSSD